ncbi:hypothetical protein P9139_17995 [Curtobacterium flaccumfaciens]|nr:hypothetical protein P9139_17995 [Curtobacterium flaccumfaciens]
MRIANETPSSLLGFGCSGERRRSTSCTMPSTTVSAGTSSSSVSVGSCCGAPGRMSSVNVPWPSVVP